MDHRPLSYFPSFGDRGSCDPECRENCTDPARAYAAELYRLLAQADGEPRTVAGRPRAVARPLWTPTSV